MLPLTITDVNCTYLPESTIVQLDFKWESRFSRDRWLLTPITLYLGNDTQTAGLLTLWFQQYLGKINISMDNQWIRLSPPCVEYFVPNKDNGILPVEVEQYWPVQRIAEHFSLPHVNDFIYIVLGQELANTSFVEQECFQLRFTFNRPFPESQHLSAENFQLNCVPAINLLKNSNPEQEFNQSSYPLTTPKGTQLYTVTKVQAVTEADEYQKGERGETLTYQPVSEFVPLYHQNAQHRLYYSVMLKTNVIEQTEAVMTFIDSQGKQVESMIGEFFQCHFLCIDNAADQIAIGDITVSTTDIPKQLTFSNITPATAAVPPLANSNEHWPLISHLSLNPFFLGKKETIQDVLNDMDIYTHIQRAGNKKRNKQLDGIIAVATHPMDWLVKGIPVRGLNLSVTLDSHYFSDEGEMYRLGHLIAYTFNYCITDNSFLQVDIIHQNRGDIWQLPAVFGIRHQI